MDFTVVQYGVDTSGRAVLMTAWMHDWFEAVVDDLGWRPVIVQGAFMSRIPGGGAKDSAGYHDLGGCLDLRTRDLTLESAKQLVRTVRRHGAAGWRRDQQHGGMDPHLHLVLGTDSPLTLGAARQWSDYIDGGDGLAGGGTDYEFRPDPLVLAPPEEIVSPEQEDRIVERIVAALLAATVDKDKTVSVKQSLNQTRNDVDVIRAKLT